MAEQEAGFELTLADAAEATFFPWAESSLGSKDMMIIDRCTAMPLQTFFEALDDEVERTRGPILLAMIGISIRAKYPEWSVERIMRAVESVDLQQVEFVSSTDEAEQVGADPLAETDGTAKPTGEPSTNSVGTSSPSATPAASTPSDTSRPIPA